MNPKETTNAANLAGNPSEAPLKRGKEHQAHERHDYEQHLRLRGEKLHAQKEQAQLGEVILRKEVVKEDQAIDVPVKHEEVVIERRACNEEEPFGGEETIRIPVMGEKVNVTKDTVTIGDVMIGKRQVEETQHYKDSVRHEEVRMEREGNIPIFDSKGQTQRPSMQAD